MLKKIAPWVVGIFVIWFIISSPAAAANMTRGIGGFIATAAQSFGDFFTRLFGG